MFASVTISDFFANFVSFGYGKVVGDAAGSGIGQVTLGMLSGGVGSALTGGNFWEGVQIGGIVAGFNHAMHRIQQVNFRKQLTDAGYNPDGIPDFSDEAIKEMIEKVPELKRLYELGGKNAIIKAIGYIPKEDGATPSRDLGITKGRYILISKSLNLTIWDLATTLGHEMIHVYHNAFLMDKLRGFTRGSWRAAYDISEVEAYHWEAKMGNTLRGESGQTLKLEELRKTYKINYKANGFY